MAARIIKPFLNRLRSFLEYSFRLKIWQSLNFVNNGEISDLLCRIVTYCAALRMFDFNGFKCAKPVVIYLT
jgi:hypothetical protein